MDDIFLQVLRRMVNEQLAPVLIGSLATFVAVFFKYRLPEEFEAVRQRIIRIEKRQKILASMLQELMGREGKYLEINDFETLFSGSHDDDEDTDLRI